MSLHEQLKKLWFEVSDVALPIAALRDEYAKGPLMNKRFCQLEDVYRNLNDIEQGISEFIESKKPLFSKKLEQEFLMIARPAIANAKILLDIATDELMKTAMSSTILPELASVETQISPERFEELAALASQLPKAEAEKSLRLKKNEIEGLMVQRKIDALKMAVNDPRLSEETRNRSKRALEMGQAVQRYNAIKHTPGN